MFSSFFDLVNDYHSENKIRTFSFIRPSV